MWWKCLLLFNVSVLSYMLIFTKAQPMSSKFESRKCWENCIHKISRQEVLAYVKQESQARCQAWLGKQLQ